MAVSLALNWSPPASSPLFDDVDTSGKPKSADQAGDSTLTSSPTRLTPTSSNSNPMYLHGGGSFSAQSRAGLGAPQVPRSLSTSPQPRSYASAVQNPTDTPQRAGTAPPGQQTQGPFLPQGFHNLAPQLPHMVSFTGQPPFMQAQAFAGPQIPMHFPPVQPSGTPLAWAQYQQQQMNAAHALQQQQQQQQQQSHQSSVDHIAASGSDGRRRATSGPQRAPQLNYSDAIQHYPGLPYAQMRANSTAGAGLPPAGLQQHSGAPSNQPQGFHPYRRAVPRASESAPSSSQGVLSPSASAATAAGAAQLPMPNWPRARTNSSGSERSGLPSERKRTGPPPPQSYSAVAAASLRGIPANHGSDGMSSSAGQRRGSESSGQTSRSTSRDARPPVLATHGRAESFSSQQSAHSAYSSSDKAPGSSVHNAPMASSGRTTPTPAAKKPSPLSHGAVDPTSEDDTGADLSGDGDGRTTPVPGGKKKGFSGKLRKALSFSSMADLQHEDSRAQSGASLVARRGLGMNEPPSSTASAGTNASTGSTQSTSPPLTPDNGGTPTIPYSSSAASISSRRSTRPPIAGSGEHGPKRSLFNRKFNSSTDNISISSTVSSASVMLRKMGSFGKLAKRNSLMALTNVFKDRDTGRDGLHEDSGSQRTDSTSTNKAAKKAAKASKKGAPVAASVSHATVEIESAASSQNFGSNGMTPAESFVQQHQIQMRQEAEARAQRERELSAASAASDRSPTMVEKEKERLKSKRGWRKKPAAKSGNSTPTGLETTLADSFDSEYSPHGVGSNAYSGGAGYVGGADSSSSYAAPQLDAIEAHGEFGVDLEPPRMPGAHGPEDSGDEYETDSLRHWGEGIERSRASAALIKAPKGILKNSEPPAIPNSDAVFGRAAQPRSATSTSDARPARLRSNSYGAPQQQAAPNAQAGMAHLSSTTEGVDRMDGIPRQPEAEQSRSHDGEGSDAEGDASFSTPVGSRPTSRTPSVGDAHSSPIGHHANASMPTLSLMLGPGPATTRTMPTSTRPQKRLVFAEDHIYHSTWPATVYDRRGELATCNRLTPVLAQRIKEELNTYKMEEMQVAPSSRIHTHFFV